MKDLLKLWSEYPGSVVPLAMFFDIISIYRTQVSWSDLCVWLSETTRPSLNLTDVTLADEDTNSILTDKVNRTIQGSVAMQVAPSGDKIWN